MTNQEILEKTIRKAIDNGCSAVLGEPLGRWLAELKFEDDIMVREASATVLIFNHDFAKALWGDKKTVDQFTLNAMIKAVHDTGGDNVYVADASKPAWQCHLQQMVIADDPIKYLGANL